MNSYFQLPTMFPDTWFLLLTVCGGAACIAWVFISSRKSPRPPLPPGPSGLPVVGSLPFMGPELHSYFAELCNKYGPLVSLRMGQKIGIVIGSASGAKEVLKDLDLILANHGATIASKEATYGGFDLLWTFYGPEWRMLRKVCVRGLLGSTALDASYDLRKHEFHQTISYLQEQTGRAVNIGDQMFLTAMNVVASMIWGGTIECDERAKLGADFRVLVTDITDLLGAPNLSDFFPALEMLDLQGIMKKMRVCVKRFDGIFEAMIDQHRKKESVEDVGNKDFLQSLLEMEGSSGGDSKIPFTMLHVKSLLMDMVTGGTDTTSNTVEFAMAELVNKPEIMIRAQEEVDTLLGSSNAPLDESRILQLPYLRAIMKETLRLHPVLPLMVPHCPTKSCIVGGYTIPKGSRVFVNVWGIHRDPLLWEDPLEFKPERFMDGNHHFSGDDFSYIPFGSGRRICSGIAMAERMVLYSLANLLHHFDWRLPEGVEKVDLAEKFGITLKKRTPLLLIPSPRSSI